MGIELMAPNLLFPPCYRRFLDVKEYADELESTFKTLLEIRQVGIQLNDTWMSIGHSVDD